VGGPEEEIKPIATVTQARSPSRVR